MLGIIWLDNVILWSLFGFMVYLWQVHDWFQPRQQMTTHMLEAAVAMPFNYLSTAWTLEAFIILLSWWLLNEWFFQTRGRDLVDQIRLSWEKMWG